MTIDSYRCGYVAILGRPNVGKSTLLNRILGQKISITSRKPQTTRHRILGVHTSKTAQSLFVDTPGIHFGSRKVLNQYMNRAALDALAEVDLLLYMVQGTRLTEADEAVLKLIQSSATPAIAVINKTDKLRDKSLLLPLIEQLSAMGRFAEIVPVSAQTGQQVEQLLELVEDFLPQSPPLFAEDQITDRSLRFLAAETVREKLMRQLGEEVPYGCSVEIETFEQQGDQTVINALIWVEKPGHKSIVIGKGGERLKRIGSDARQDLIKLIEGRVHLQCWVKVKGGWTNSDKAVRQLAYADENFGLSADGQPGNDPSREG